MSWTCFCLTLILKEGYWCTVYILPKEHEICRAKRGLFAFLWSMEPSKPSETYRFINNTLLIPLSVGRCVCLSVRSSRLISSYQLDQMQRNITDMYSIFHVTIFRYSFCFLFTFECPLTNRLNRKGTDPLIKRKLADSEMFRPRSTAQADLGRYFLQMH